MSCLLLTIMDVCVRCRSTVAVFHIVCAHGVALQESLTLSTRLLCLDICFVEIYV
jgi:hypothetical protein